MIYTLSYEGVTRHFPSHDERLVARQAVAMGNVIVDKMGFHVEAPLKGNMLELWQYPMTAAFNEGLNTAEADRPYDHEMEPRPAPVKRKFDNWWGRFKYAVVGPVHSHDEGEPCTEDCR